MTDGPQQGLLRQFLDALREGSIPFDTSVLAKSPIALRSGESLAFVCYEAALKEPHAVDKGDLVLTTQRYVFLGQKRTIGVDLSEIIGVEPYGDAVAIHRAGKEQTEMYGDLNRQEIAYTADGQTTRSTADELAKLADLRDRGALTDGELARLKAELIG